MGIERMFADLQGRIAVVTGGATGIGHSVACRLGELGATVVIAGRNRPRGEAAAQALVARGYHVAFARTDVRSESEVNALMEHTARTYGGIDLVFNNAGTEGPKSPLETFSHEMVDEIVGTNLKGAFWGMKHAVPHLAARRGGVIVNTASFVGTIAAVPDAIIYGATKAAVLSMTSSMALACASDGIRIYAVCPWITDTPMIDRLCGESGDAKTAFAALNPSGHIVDPAEIADVVLGLFTGALPFDSGDAVLVDHGGVVRRLGFQQRSDAVA
jgi:NAD(P)-dependent dehydrogenase (short-subunit alcohol dehydrogenase family)